jgi:hypothetical protein
MGNHNIKDEETSLLLFTLFGILVLLFLLLITVCVGTWALWRMAKVVIEQNAEDGGESGGVRRSVRGSGTAWLGGGTLVGREEGGEEREEGGKYK